MTTAEVERETWRGKVRVYVRANSLGEVEHSAQIKLRWWMNWQIVASGPTEWRGGYNLIPTEFPTMEAAKLAAQLKWNDADAKHKANLAKRFGDWRKVWP